MKLLKSGLILMLLLLANTASAGSIESARRLIDLLDVPTTLENTIIQSIQQARGTLLSRGMPADQVNRVSSTLQAEMLDSMPELLGEIAGMYADEFSENELQDLIGFYETSTGQKFVQSQSRLNRRRGTILENWMQDVSERARSRMLGV